MAGLVEQLLSLALAGTMMISTGLDAAAPHNDIEGVLFLQNRQWRAGSAYIPELRRANMTGKVREMRDDAATALEEMAADCKAETGEIIVSGRRWAPRPGRISMWPGPAHPSISWAWRWIWAGMITTAAATSFPAPRLANG